MTKLYSIKYVCTSLMMSEDIRFNFVGLHDSDNYFKSITTIIILYQQLTFPHFKFGIVEVKYRANAEIPLSLNLLRFFIKLSLTVSELNFSLL